MKYVYINPTEDRLVCICSKRSKDHFSDPTLQEYVVSDSFDMNLRVETGDGEVVFLEGAISAKEFVNRYDADYVARRVSQYPSVEDQLDAFWKGGEDAEIMRQKVMAVKRNNPKPEKP